MKMGLCRACDQFDIRQVVHHTIRSGAARIPLDTIREGTLRECDFCLVLLAALRRIATGHETLEEKKAYLYLGGFNSKKELITNTTQPEIVLLGVWLEDREKNVFVRSPAKKTQTVYLPVKADLSSPAATSRCIRGRFSGFRTDSPETTSIISEWLERCCTNHRHCSPIVPTGPKFTHLEVPLPTRCLEITHKVVRLRETKGMKGQYVILSHRWSRATEAYQTTTKNYDDRLRGRGLADLTRLFNHAVELTLKLGFRYIWIDSFCIIQKGDDGLDWNSEVMNMAQYFQQAVFTILALRSQKKGAGVFVARQQPFVPLAQFPFRDKSGAARGNYYITDQQNVDFVEDFVSQVRQQDLFKRAWIFQEWYLSTRVVYFTSRCVWFECKSSYPVMENQEEVSPTDSKLTLNSGVDNSGARAASFFKTEYNISESEPDQLWYRLVQMYSELYLSHPGKDRVIALSGIAKVIRDKFMEHDRRRKLSSRRYEYLAGLWLSDIHNGLLWFQRHPDEEYTPLAGPPTWSWASSMHAVHWFWGKSVTKPMMKVTALATRLPGRDIYSWFTIEDPVPGIGAISLIHDSNENPYSIGPFDVDNKTCHLRASVKMVPVLVGDILDHQQTQSMRLESNLLHDEECTLRWHAICPETNTESIGGWATIEAPYLLAQLQQYTATVIVALHVSTRSTASDPNGYLNTFRPARSVYDVLMVEHIGNNCYRRVGMGCITDEQLMKRFDECEICQVDLV